MRQTIAPLAPGLSAIAAVLLVGCTAPQVTHRLLDAPRPSGQLNLFGQAGGVGALSIRVVDQRPRKTQSFVDADTFNGVFFRLSNTFKLKTSLQVATASQGVGNPTYSAMFPAIPADSGGHYTLSVGLFRGITTPTDPNDGGYTDFRNKVGEGASGSITINPGQSKNVTIIINAVGDFFVDSPTLVVDSANPVLMSGGQAFVDTKVNTANNPDTDLVNVYLTTAGDVLVPGASVSFANVASPSTVVATSVPLPFVASTDPFKLVVENSRMASGDRIVLSRRTRDVQIEATASIGNITLQ